MILLIMLIMKVVIGLWSGACRFVHYVSTPSNSLAPDLPDKKRSDSCRVEEYFLKVELAAAMKTIE